VLTRSYASHAGNALESAASACRTRRRPGPVSATAMGREGPPQGANRDAARSPHSRAGQRCNTEWPLAAGLPEGLWPEQPHAVLQILAGYEPSLRSAVVPAAVLVTTRPVAVAL